jgi:hypothetical protein
MGRPCRPFQEHVQEKMVQVIRNGCLFFVTEVGVSSTPPTPPPPPSPTALTCARNRLFRARRARRR